MDAGAAVLAHFAGTGGRRSAGSWTEEVVALLDKVLRTVTEGEGGRVKRRRPLDAHPEGPGKRHKGKVIPLLRERLSCGAEALAHRQGDGDWASFLREHCGTTPGEAGYDAARQRAYRCLRLAEKAETEGVTGATGRGRRATGVRSHRIRPEQRRRAQGRSGRPEKMPDLSHELFQYWVDMGETLKSRVPSHMLISQAWIIVGDAQRYVEECDAAGIVAPRLQIPSLDSVWLSRWRAQWSLTPQSVNCKYTVSFAKLEKRLGVTWRNAARLLFLHERLFGPGGLEFLTIDEKPYHFNAIGGDKVWRRRGTKKKAVKEKRQHMLERWTGMTSCSSKGCQPGTVPKWAALFKAEDGSRTHLRVPEGVKVQFAPHGSYRTEHVLDYLEWRLEDVEDPRETTVPVLDWYAAHLAEEVQDLVKEKGAGSPTLYLGGGTTSVQSSCDAFAHFPSSTDYKRMEAVDQTRALAREI